MLRALRILRDEGLLEFRRGRGITVTGSQPRGAMVGQVRDLMQSAGRLGYGRDEVIEMLRNLPDANEAPS